MLPPFLRSSQEVVSTVLARPMKEPAIVIFGEWLMMLRGMNRGTVLAATSAHPNANSSV